MSDLRQDALNSIVEWVSPEAGKVEAWLLFGAQAAVFEGHFPDHPLVPGVLEIETLKMTVQRALDKPLRILSIPRCKFMREIKPDEKVKLEASWAQATETGKWTVRGVLSVGAERAAQIDLVVGDDE